MAALLALLGLALGLAPSARGGLKNVMFFISDGGADAPSPPTHILAHTTFAHTAQ
jgi:hypothetical protein